MSESNRESPAGVEVKIISKGEFVSGQEVKVPRKDGSVSVGKIIGTIQKQGKEWYVVIFDDKEKVMKKYLSLEALRAANSK